MLRSRSLLCGLGLVSLRIAVRAAEPPGVLVQADGVPALRVPLEARGGMLIPEPAAVLSLPRGTVALEMKIDEFPANGIVLDFGTGSSSHVVIAGTYDGSSSARGHFWLEVFDDHGISRKVEGPMLDAGEPCLLAFSYQAGRFTFWVNGKSIGTVAGNLKATPDRLALIDPIGLQWSRVALWSESRGEEQLRKLMGEDSWTLDSQTTFLAMREGSAGAPQTGLIGTALMTPATTLEDLGRQAAPRDLWVDGARGSADGDGSAGKPFQTISAAAAIAGPGVTVTVAPGTYRESVVLTLSGTEKAPVTFRASTDGPVTLEGADPISGFQAAGSVAGASLWVKTGFSSRDVPYGSAQQREVLGKLGPAAMKQLERRGRVDAIWCDGSLLSKAESSETLRSHSFWVDREKNELVVALDSEDRAERHRFERGMRGPLISGTVSHIHLEGFRLRHDDAPIGHGAIDLTPSSSHWLVENIDESGANWCGIRLGGWQHVLRNNVWEKNGDDGIDGSLIQYALVEGDAARFNNWQRGINPNWGAGGVKLTQVQHMTFRNCEIGYNLGIGIWFDCNNIDLTIEGCRSHHNAAGLFVEISPGPFVFRNNVCFANDGAGIQVGESDHGLIENNTLVDNKSGIDLRNIPGRNADYHGAGLGLLKPGQAWTTSDIVIRRNIIAQNTVAGLTNTAVRLDPVRDRISSDYNLFFANAAIVGWPPQQGAESKIRMSEVNDWAVPRNDGGGTRLTSLAAVHKLLGLEEHSLVADPHFSYPAAYEYDVDPAGPAARLFSEYR